MVNILSRAEYSFLFNERSYNPVDSHQRSSSPNTFSDKFQDFLILVERVLKLCGFSDDYYLHDAHNWSHVVDVHFETEEVDQYMDTKVVRLMAELVLQQQDDWMILLCDSTTLFITKTGIGIFNYEESYPMFERVNAEVGDLYTR